MLSPSKRSSPSPPRARCSTSARSAPAPTVTQIELEKIPTARDPWVILQSVPGVHDLNDRQRRRNKSGLQDVLRRHRRVHLGQHLRHGRRRHHRHEHSGGSSPRPTTTSSRSRRSRSPPAAPTSRGHRGHHLNMVTKRGTNEWRGSARYIVADDAWQSEPLRSIPATSARARRSSPRVTAS